MRSQYVNYFRSLVRALLVHLRMVGDIEEEAKSSSTSAGDAAAAPPAGARGTADEAEAAARAAAASSAATSSSRRAEGEPPTPKRVRKEERQKVLKVVLRVTFGKEGGSLTEGALSSGDMFEKAILRPMLSQTKTQQAFANAKVQNIFCWTPSPSPTHPLQPHWILLIRLMRVFQKRRNSGKDPDFLRRMMQDNMKVGKGTITVDPYALQEDASGEGSESGSEGLSGSTSSSVSATTAAAPATAASASATAAAAAGAAPAAAATAATPTSTAAAQKKGTHVNTVVKKIRAQLGPTYQESVWGWEGVVEEATSVPTYLYRASNLVQLLWDKRAEWDKKPAGKRKKKDSAARGTQTGGAAGAAGAVEAAAEGGTGLEGRTIKKRRRLEVAEMAAVAAEQAIAATRAAAAEQAQLAVAEPAQLMAEAHPPAPELGVHPLWADVHGQLEPNDQHGGEHDEGVEETKGSGAAEQPPPGFEVRESSAVLSTAAAAAGSVTAGVVDAAPAC